MANFVSEVFQFCHWYELCCDHADMQRRVCAGEIVSEVAKPGVSCVPTLAI